MDIDQIDVQILRLLTENSRIQWRDIGEQIHMTGQAVGNRIKKMEDNGIIQAYSLVIDEMKLGFSFTAFVVVHMKTANHDTFIRFIQDHQAVVEAHRVSGEGCYHLKAKVGSQNQLNLFLDQLLEHGNYSLHLSIQEIKQHHPMRALKP